jgi:hypothetical protein
MTTRIQRKVNSKEARFCAMFATVSFDQVHVTLASGTTGTKHQEAQGLDHFLAYLMRSETKFHFEDSRRDGFLRLIFDIGDSIGRINFEFNKSAAYVNGILA